MKTTAIVISIFFIQSLSAQDATVLYQEGVKLKYDKKTSEAAEKFKRAVVLKPDYTEAYYELGWCQNDMKDYYGAITNLRMARKSWSTIPKVHFELGYAFQNTDQPDSALRCYTECLHLKPDYSLAYKQLGYIAYNANDNKTAKENFEKYEAATKIEITDYLYWYRKGFVLNALADYSNSVVALKKSLDFKTDYINTYLELGYASMKQKLDDDAISYYKKAIEIDPSSHVPYNGIAEVYRDNKKDCSQAISWYEKTLAINSTERKACFGKGYCLNSIGKYDEAAGYLKTAIQAESTYTAAYVELGYSHYMLGKLTEGLEMLNKALALSPNNQNARYYSGLIYIKQGNKAMAQKMADELKTLNSKNAATLQSKVNEL